MASNNNNNNRVMNKNAKPALKNLKTEVANELGMTNYDQTDKGNLTARENGYVGGYMVKKMIQYAEQNMPSASSASGMTMGMSK